jgi:Acyl-CoA reductase (LuxC)
MNKTYVIPLVARGETITDSLVTYEGRRGGLTFSTPDTAKYFAKLTLSTPSMIGDLYQLTFDDILDYLVELGNNLHLDKNEYLAQALEVSKITSGLSDSVLEAAYTNMHKLFNRDTIREIAETSVGLEYLEGWVPSSRNDGRKVNIRAFGARSIHIVAGNLPEATAATIVRNAITRSDALIKTPSNDPMTAVAFAQTMIKMDPAHPMTRHVAVAYWRGGDEAIESRLYQPRNVEKIVAWGGFASVKHISKYLQPGIDLITLDPKLSASIVGKQVFASEQSMADVAVRMAIDVAAYNQEACVNARVIYVECDMDETGIAKLNRLGDMMQKCIAHLPAAITSKPKPGSVSKDLVDELAAIAFSEDSYHVFGKDINDGIVVVSQFDDPVDFSGKLANRVANLVPVPSIEAAISFVAAETQTIGVYPESLKKNIRNQLAFFGGQRLVSLGYAAHLSLATPQDGIEPIRRMCKWIFEEECDPKVVAPIWKTQSAKELALVD